MEIHTLASGSAGNSILISSGTDHILIDAGISCRKITTRLASLGLALSDLRGIFITHTHRDHIDGLPVLTRKAKLPIYLTEHAAADLLCRKKDMEVDTLHYILPQDPVRLGKMEITGFSTSHDAPGSMGYLISDGIRRAAVVTDLGYVSASVHEAVRSVDAAVIESNYDADWLRNGPYPYLLQERILGPTGHLSNECCAELALRLVREGTSLIILAHLSDENNSPDHALKRVKDMLSDAGCCGVRISVAPRDSLSDCFEI